VRSLGELELQGVAMGCIRGCAWGGGRVGMGAGIMGMHVGHLGIGLSLCIEIASLISGKISQSSLSTTLMLCKTIIC